MKFTAAVKLNPKTLMAFSVVNARLSYSNHEEEIDGLK
jgi:hypothetical protein